MAEIHQLIRIHGVDGAKALAGPAHRPLIDAAAAVLAAENPGLSLCYSGFALTALPHRRLAAGEKWRREGHNLTLIITPGELPDALGVSKVHGVPSGAIARLILLYLQTQALKTDDPTVVLGRTMRDWLDRMGLSIGGKTFQMVREQARLISICHLQFIFQGPGGQVRVTNDAIVRNAILPPTADAHQPSLWEDTVQLSDTFFKALKDHPVPLAEPAIREISNNSTALDVYIWLAYRLHSLDRPTPVGWPALRRQFGAEYACPRTFKRRFLQTLAKALAVYPDARVDIDDGGVLLHPSRPPVPHRPVPIPFIG